MTEEQVNCDDSNVFLEFDVCGQRLVRTDTLTPTSDTVKIFEALFNYKQGNTYWNQYVHKYVIFRSETGESYCVDLGYETEQSDVLIPAKVLTGDFFQVTLMGIDDRPGVGGRNVTNPVTVHLRRSGFTDKLQAYDPEMDNGDIFSELMELIRNRLLDVTVEGNQLLFYKEEEIYYRFTINNHQHTSNQITDIEDTIGVEIKRSYQYLVNKIRTYGE